MGGGGLLVLGLHTLLIVWSEVFQLCDPDVLDNIFWIHLPYFQVYFKRCCYILNLCLGQDSLNSSHS